MGKTLRYFSALMDQPSDIVFPPGLENSYITKGDLYKWECSVLAYLTRIAEQTPSHPKVVEVSDSDSEADTSSSDSDKTDKDSESDSSAESEEASESESASGRTSESEDESESQSSDSKSSARTLVKCSGKPSYIRFTSLPHYKKPKGKPFKFAWATNQSSKGRVEKNSLIMTSSGTVPDAFILSKVF